ncbi:MAG TPA: PIN domain-containing protein [Thermoanaerobaculia bacterium]|nr:PIN domain-containing protein [Thermoanaerobaculia bacterium]
MRVYLDLCCLKRPFDLQEQPLIRLQTEAVLSILALPSDTVELLQSEALVLENSLNPNQARREAVALWLSEAAVISLDESDLSSRINELIAKGFKSFDAFHLASAELSGVAVFLTVDRQFLSLAARMSGELRVRVTDPVHFIEEISQWKH